MEYKILEANGIENENIDGGAFNNFCAGGQSGVVINVLNECKITNITNALTVSTGLLLLSGIRVKITEPVVLSISNNPAVDTNYQVIARINLSNNGKIDFSLMLRIPQDLVQENLYINNQGTFEIELATFIHSTNGSIKDVVTTFKKISNLNEERITQMINNAIGSALTGEY